MQFLQYIQQPYQLEFFQVETTILSIKQTSKVRKSIMEMTMRWYGKNHDTVTLEQIKQSCYVTGKIGRAHV